MDKGEYNAKDSRSENINEIDETRRDAKSELERGTDEDEILSTDYSNEDISYTDNLLEACFQGSLPLTTHGLP